MPLAKSLLLERCMALTRCW